MSGLISDPLGNAALAPPGQNAPTEAYPRSVWDFQNPFDLEQMAWRGGLRAGAEYGFTDPESGAQLLPPAPTIPAAEAQQKYGIPGELTFPNPVPESVARDLYEAKREELWRREASADSDAGFLRRAAAGLATGAVDPLNLAAGLVPGIGEARVMGALARGPLDNLLGRSIARFAAGGSAGLAAQVPLTALRYGLSQQDQADYSANDAMADIIMGGVLAGGLHTAIGTGADLIGQAFKRSGAAALAEDDPGARAKMATAAIAQAAADAPVDLTPTLAGAPLGSGYRARMLARGETAQENYRVYTADGMSAEVRPEVVEAADLTASNDDAGRVNPDFPRPLQPRDRTSAASQAQITEMASRLEPERLGRNVEAAAGAPIVSPEGVVESGNGRVLALRRVYGDQATFGDQATAYRAYLQAQGFDVAGMTAPVLIARRVTEMDEDTARRFAEGANAAPVMAMNASEQARLDVQRVAKAIHELKPGNITGPRNKDFVGAFMAQVTKEERNALIDSTGELAPAGAARIRAAVLAHAYGDALGPTLERLLNDDVPHMRHVAGALADIAPLWSRMRAGVAAGEVPAGLDITPSLGEAVQTLDQARRSGSTVADHLAQADMFSRPSAPAEAFMRAMFRDEAMRRPVSRERLADLLADYAGHAMDAKAGPDLFGAGETRPAEILRLLARDDANAGRIAEALERRLTEPTGLRTAPEERAPARPARAAPPESTEPVTGFRTAKGSAYEVHDDGTTTRNKAFRPEHGEAEQGPQPRSERTFYVTKADAEKLGEFQARGTGSKAIAPLADGTRWGMKYLDGDNAGRFEQRTVVTPQDQPAAGLIPVEVWQDGKRVHFGNEITELTRAGEAPGKPLLPAEGEGDTAAPIGDTPAADSGRIEDGTADLFGEQPAQPPNRLTIQPSSNLTEQIAALEQDFRAMHQAGSLDPEAADELARIAEDDQKAQTALQAIGQAATCLLGGLGL